MVVCPGYVNCAAAKRGYCVICAARFSKARYCIRSNDEELWFITDCECIIEDLGDNCCKLHVTDLHSFVGMHFDTGESRDAPGTWGPLMPSLFDARRKTSTVCTPPRDLLKS